MDPDPGMMSAWFAGPKAENAPWFTAWLGRIAEDYNAWRRNYFPEDGVVVDSALRRQHEPFVDAFEDRLLELLARLKADVPFHSPRYAAHMLAEQTLPGIAGYFAAMLYNPNNITTDVAPVTVRLELEAGRMISRMIGYGEGSWSHLCSGGTAANIEALWVARSVLYLPLAVRDARRAIGPAADRPDDGADAAALMGRPVGAKLAEFAGLWREAAAADRRAEVRAALDASAYNVAERGLAAVCASLGSSPVLLVPESHHYCFEKSMDLLGLGRRGLVSVRVDAGFRMRTDELAAALDRVEREGRPVLGVVAVIGSTEEGSVDPLDEIVELRRARERDGRPSFWLHADGAYGGYLRSMTIPVRTGLGEASATVKIGAGPPRAIPIHLPEHRECAALERLGESDSVTIDPHKLGYIPYPAGAVCFRDNLVKPLMRQAAPYLAERPTDVDAERTSDAIGLYVLEGSKPGASAAAVWLSHSLIPLDSSGHGLLMRENIRNACELHALLEGFGELAPRAGGATATSSAGVTTPSTGTGTGIGAGAGLGVRAVCLCPPGSNIVCYAFRPEAGAGLAMVNRLNRAVFDRFNLHAGRGVYEQSFFLSRTALSSKQYSLETVGDFLRRLGVDPAEYPAEGVFLLRSVLMNPWYAAAKRRGRYYLSELASELHKAAGEIWRQIAAC